MKFLTKKKEPIGRSTIIITYGNTAARSDPSTGPCRENIIIHQWFPKVTAHKNISNSTLYIRCLDGQDFGSSPVKRIVLTHWVLLHFSWYTKNCVRVKGPSLAQGRGVSFEVG